MLDPERGVSTLCPFEPESVARNHLSSLNHRGRILANASLGARVLTTRSLTLVPPLVRRQDPSQEAPLAKKPRPADSAGDKDDDDDDDVVVEKRGAPSSGAGGDAKDGDDDDEGEREIADGDDFERRRKRGGASGATNKNKNTNLDDGDDEEDEMANDEARGADREKMAEMLRYFTPEQMDRYECYRRSSLPKPVLRRVFQAVTGTILNPNGLIVLAAVGKLFVGELVELAREIADDEGVSDLEEIKPAHVREAHRRMEQSGNLFRAKKKPLFRKRGA
jgi:transcription initiation factor TFIID subunit 11